jgi:hypothetical protein
MHVNSIRNLCYVNAMAELGLLPGTRSAGEVCLLPGLSMEERFNVKDWNGLYIWDERSSSLVMRLDMFPSWFMKEEQAMLASDLPSDAKMLIEYPPEPPQRIRKLRMIKPGVDRSKLTQQHQMKAPVKQQDKMHIYSELMEKRNSTYNSLSKQHRERIDKLHRAQADALELCQRQFNRALFAYHAKDNPIIDHLAANFLCQFTHFGESQAVGVASSRLQAYVSSYGVKVDIPELSRININSCSIYNESRYHREEEKRQNVAESEECRDAILKPFRDHIHPIVRKTADNRPAAAFEVSSNIIQGS